MEISLRLDTLGMVELRYLRGRERYREWPQFQLLAASRQARVLAYFTHDVAEQLHQQILMVEAAVGLDVEDAEDEDDDDDDDDDDEKLPGDETENENEKKEVTAERDTTAFSPAFAQALKQLNEFARQRLPDGGASSSQVSGELPSELDPENEEDALEQLQDAFVQMMEVVRELAEEMSTDALKLTSRFKCARTNIEFIPRADSPDDDDDDDDDHVLEMATEEGILDIEVELVMVLQLFEEGRARADDLPAVELQLDVDDFEHLHETLDIALERERRSRRRR
ncbi:MAG: hypothetical protein H0V70_09675 [Ktedonobacteraceae bacterium]|nr:hypothetical protein [Ktedonobacteraceae bacterium]